MQPACKMARVNNEFRNKIWLRKPVEEASDEVENEGLVRWRWMGREMKAEFDSERGWRDDFS